jgi:hypothetical protein
MNHPSLLSDPRPLSICWKLLRDELLEESVSDEMSSGESRICCGPASEMRGRSVCDVGGAGTTRLSIPPSIEDSVAVVHESLFHSLIMPAFTGENWPSSVNYVIDFAFGRCQYARFWTSAPSTWVEWDARCQPTTPQASSPLRSVREST